MTELRTFGRVRLVGAAGVESNRGIQPKRVALLAYLALATSTGPVRRDALLALFWPELDDDEARRALRQALHYLRRVVGDDVLVSAGEELSLREGALRCDAVAFEQLVAAERFDEALALYRGDYFEGFHVDDVAPELEEWVERTRSRFRRRAASAAWSLADVAALERDVERALELGRRACELEPDQEAGWRRLMRLHDQLGDRAGALRTYQEFSDWLEREFEAQPSTETASLAERIRTATPLTTVSDPSTSGTTPEVTPIRIEPSPRARRPAIGLAVIAGCVIVAAALGAYRTISNGSDDSPSLVASGAIAEHDRVVVADFTDLAGDSLLAAGITEAFRVDLGQSPLVRVMSSPQVAGALARMERRADTVFTEPLAREVAEREGAKAIVTGSIANVGGAFTINVRLLSAADGEALFTLREAAADSSALLDAVDRASKQLRHRIGESLRSLRSQPPLANGTSASLGALRKYTEAQRHFLAGRRPEAIRLFEEAVSIDTAFASAWSTLGMAYGSIAEIGRATDAQRRAVAHQRRLPPYERGIILGSYAHAAGDFETAASEYRRMLERYPDDFRALNNLALVHRDLREFTAAESLFRRAARVDSTIPNFYFGIHSTQLLRGRFAESRQTLDLIARRFPGHPILLNVEIQDAAAQQQWERAERQAETTIGAAQGDTLALVDPYEALAAVVMTQGRLREAERHWRTQLTLSAAAGSRGRHLFGLLQLAKLEQLHRRDTARALALVDSALTAMPLDSVLPGDRPYDDLARFYASAGRVASARRLLAATPANDSVLGRVAGPDRAWTRGVIALAEGRSRDAESELRQAAEALVCEICALPDLARSYEATGKPDAAIAVYERYLSTPWLFRYEVDGTELGWAFKRLAELYDARGETAKAEVTRGRLRQLWRRADPELQAVLASLRPR